MAIRTKSLGNDIRQYLKAFATRYAQEGAKEITALAGPAIQSYYDQYAGYKKYYNRTEDLLKNSYVRYYHNNGRAVYGGVAINAQHMQDYGSGKYKTAKEKVAEWAWLKGYHGYLNHDINDRIYTFPPFAMLQQAVEYNKIPEKAAARAEKYASSLKYKVLRMN